MERRPKGYVGINHETIGSDVLAVMHSLQSLVGPDLPIPKHILTPAQLQRLQSIKPDGWYPIEWLLELMDALDKKLGRYALIKMGRTLFKQTHEARVLETAHQGRDIIYGFDEMYHHANRGEKIGGWRVISFDDNGAVLEKTTPHHCAMEEGILAQALAAVGAPAMVAQTGCFREGADACLYSITPAVGAGRWM